MGKGRIVAAHGEGRYTLELAEDRARAQTARALAVQHVAELESRISALENDLDAAEQAVAGAVAEQDAAIVQYQQDMVEDGASSVDLATVALAVQEAIGQRSALQRQLKMIKAERLSRQALIKRIDSLPPLRQIEAWCADFTEDLSGEVATAEIPGEVGKVIIKPGFGDGAAWSASADGAMQPALSGTPASVFYNLAMMPGWQKWRPTFRIATISNIDNDLCDITLVPATSSQQGLSVNAQSQYAGVPIFYMDCNGDAFEDGDRVLVAFSGNTEQPMVVGFEREPRECATFWLSYTRNGVSIIGGSRNRRVIAGPIVVTENIDSCFYKDSFVGYEVESYYWSDNKLEDNIFHYLPMREAVEETASYTESFSNGMTLTGESSFTVSAYSHTGSASGTVYHRFPGASCANAEPPGESSYRIDRATSHQVTGSATASVTTPELSFSILVGATYDYEYLASEGTSVDEKARTSNASVEIVFGFGDSSNPALTLNFSYGPDSDETPYFGGGRSISYFDIFGETLHHVKRKGTELLIVEMIIRLFSRGEEADKKRCCTFSHMATGEWEQVMLADYSNLYSPNEPEFSKLTELLTITQVPIGGYT